MKKPSLILLMSALSLMTAIPAFAGGNSYPEAVVYVRDQGLYFDSIVRTGLPQKGRLQKLEMVDRQGELDCGPGDPVHIFI